MYKADARVFDAAPFARDYDYIEDAILATEVTSTAGGDQTLAAFLGNPTNDYSYIKQAAVVKNTARNGGVKLTHVLKTAAAGRVAAAALDPTVANPAVGPNSRRLPQSEDRRATGSKAIDTILAKCAESNQHSARFQLHEVPNNQVVDAPPAPPPVAPVHGVPVPIVQDQVLDINDDQMVDDDDAQLPQNDAPDTEQEAPRKRPKLNHDDQRVL